MSKKEALSQFQSRLAGRLHSIDKKDGDATANWLAVEINGHGFILPLNQSGEIFPWSEPQSIPYTKDWFLGVANLRGALCGVVSLSKYLDLKPQRQVNADSGVAASLQDRRLVGFHPSLELNTVVVVDKLIGLKNRDQMQPSGVENQYQDGQGVRWLEVDLQILSQDPVFINIAQ
jgi:twitching motility protein PilI